MSLMIPDQVLQAAHITPAELQREIAVLLFAQERLTLGQASHLAGISQFDFQHLLASRDIPIHYGVEDFERDLETLKRRDTWPREVLEFTGIPDFEPFESYRAELRPPAEDPLA